MSSLQVSKYLLFDLRSVFLELSLCPLSCYISARCSLHLLSHSPSYSTIIVTLQYTMPRTSRSSRGTEKRMARHDPLQKRYKSSRTRMPVNTQKRSTTTVTATASNSDTMADSSSQPLYFWRETHPETGYLSQWYASTFRDDQDPSVGYKTAEQ